MVCLVLGVLHLRKSDVNAVQQNPTVSAPNLLKLTEEDKEKKITQMIVGSPLAFLTYVESYVWERNSYRVLVPGESYLPMLHDNVWISGKLNFVR
jgi:hypothetical protein